MFAFIFDQKIGKQLPFEKVEFDVYDDYKREMLEKYRVKKLKKILQRYELVVDEN